MSEVCQASAVLPCLLRQLCGLQPWRIYAFPFIFFPVVINPTMETQKGKNKKTNARQGWRKGVVKMNKAVYRGFLRPWQYSVCYCNDGYKSKTTECTTPRVRPKINHGLWVIVMCLCSFFLGFKKKKKKVPFWWVMSVKGEAVYVCDLGIYRKSLCLLRNFVVNLKLPLKKDGLN